MSRDAAPARRGRLRRLAGLVFFVLVLGVLGYAARSIDWPQVLASLRRMPPGRLLLAAACSALSYTGYAFTDLFALRYLEQRVSRGRAMIIAFVSYAFNQNFGSLLGTIGFRLRLYSHDGLQPAQIAPIVGLGFITNWSGYLLLAGLAFLSRSLELPRGWGLGATGLQAVGAALLAALTGYLLLCLHARRRRWSVFGVTVELPGWRKALLQLALSTFVWLAIFATLYVLLPRAIDPRPVLAVFLLASIAGLITHVPGGLGVIEAVFLTLLGARLGRHELLASLLAYRALYYLMPLLVAVPLYLRLEARAPRQAAPERGKPRLRDDAV
ncbi:MAG TPA: lysylphosphatidylglycerol synthase domain-containing protein [Nevskia sp.]|nr:lysylphosphatidylglycerol synthase domain-containing protein [Nevskia sp.]